MACASQECYLQHLCKALLWKRWPCVIQEHGEMIQSSQGKFLGHMSSEYTLDGVCCYVRGQAGLSVLIRGSPRARWQIQHCSLDHLEKVFYRREKKLCMFKEREIRVEDH